MRPFMDLHLVLQMYLVNTFDISTIKMHLFILLEIFKSQERTLGYSNFSMTTV